MSAPNALILSKSNPSQIKPKARDQQITYYWSQPTGGTPTNYILTVGATPYTIPYPATSYTVTGLTNGTEYTANIVASNAQGTSTPAYYRTVQPGFKPDPPTNLTVIKPTSSTALVSWTAPVYTGQATIKWYVVNAVSNNIADPLIKLSAYSYSREWLVKNLNPASTYTFTVYAVNDPGYSVGTSASPEIIKSGLLLELESSNYSGGTWNDSSGNGNNATVGSGTGQTQGGFVYFDGSTYFTAPNLGTLSNFTLSLWYRPLVIPATNVLPIFGENYTHPRNFMFGYQNGNYYADAKDSMGTNIFDTGSINIQNNVWNNMVITCDGTQVIVYLNNIAAISVGVTGTFVTSGGYIYIGGGNNAIEGLIGQALIYNRALTAEEVANNYNATSPTYP